MLLNTILFCILILLLCNFKISFKIKILLLINFVIRIFLSKYFIEKMIFLPDTIEYLRRIEDNYKEFNYGINQAIIISESLHFAGTYCDIFLFKITKSHLFIMILKNFLLIVSFYYFYKISLIYFSKKFSQWYFLVLLHVPYFWIFSMYNLKDVYVLFLFSLGLKIILNNENILKGIIIILLIFPFRIYTGIALVATVIFKIVSKNNNKNIFKFFCLSIIMIVFFIQTPYFGAILRKAKFSQINFLGIVIQFFSFVYSPTIINVFKLKFPYSLLLYETTILFILTPKIVLGILNYKKKFLIFLVPVFVHAIVLGIEYGGGAVRQKIAIYPLILLLFVREIYLSLVKKKNEDEL